MVTDFQTINELERAIENRKLEEETPDGKSYRSGNYTLFESYSDAHWEQYSIQKAG
jgi:arginyl-tRNA--protein-N-Asp/Glu arginylyltransferase